MLNDVEYYNSLSYKLQSNMMNDVEYYNSIRQTFYAKLLKRRGVHIAKTRTKI